MCQEYSDKLACLRTRSYQDDKLVFEKLQRLESQYSESSKVMSAKMKWM